MFLGTTDPFPTNFLDVSGNIKIANINVTPPPIVKNINIDLQLLNELIKAAPTNPPIPLPTNCKPATAPTILPRLALVHTSPATPELIEMTAAIPAA